MTTVDILIAARAEVERGWCQHMAVDLRGNVCALGAVDTVLGEEKCARFSSVGAAPVPVIRALQRALPKGRILIAPFNDHPTTTKADILAMYDRAINAEAAKVSPDPSHTFSQAA